MQRPSHPEAPVDPRWLQQLSEGCGDLRGGGERFEDLYLEQRLELRAVTSAGETHIEECRTEGAAVRWRAISRAVLNARTGLSGRAIAELLADHSDHPITPQGRPLPPPDMDPPRAWLDWARQAADLMAPNPSVIRYIRRRAAVVRPGAWAPISTPSWVRVELGGEHPSALLAVWQHPSLGDWMRQLVEAPPLKGWRPEPGTQLPVCLTEGTAGILVHELIGHLAESDVVENSSPLADLDGANITTPAMEVVDDPLRFDLAGAFDCDDEGTAAAALSIVRDGRFERFLCDRAGGRRLGTEAGRGRRATWSQPPVSRLSNLIVKPGTTTPEKLEAALDHGLVVTRLGGATMDPISCRTVLRVERGWEIRRGRRRRPLLPFELTGNVMEVLANIDPTLGDDATTDWRLGWCVKDGLPIATGSEAPSLVVHRLEVL